MKRIRLLLACAATAAGLFFIEPAQAGELESPAPAAAPEAAPKAVLFPVREAVISNTIAANVREYRFKEGQLFNEGDVLARLDDRQYRQTKLKADALYEEAKATLAFAEENYKRSQELFGKSAIGKQELEQSKLDRDSAAAKLQYAEASMKMAGIDLDACEIKAPFAGRFAKRSVKEHEFVNAGQPVLEILDDSELLADMHLPAARRKDVKLGDVMEFKVDETGGVCKGVVHEISGRIDYESRTFEVKALVGNRDRKLSAGMSGSLLEKPR